MNCEEFEIVGLGLDREGRPEDGTVVIDREAALEHASVCPRCAALQESWREAQDELRALRHATQEVGAPLRVEMRLRREFHTRHRTVKIRAAALMTAWALAGAAVLVGAVSWWNWHVMQTGRTTQSASGSGVKANVGSGNAPVTPSTNDGTNSAAAENGRNNAASVATLVADNDAEDFTLLPGSLPQETGDAAVVRVRLQRGALSALGLPVNETRAAEWIQVDLFVGQDGQPQAVRLLR
jgi:hypothetical protein